jgi:trimeric autotransporter adhesin
MRLLQLAKVASTVVLFGTLAGCGGGGGGGDTPPPPPPPPTFTVGGTVTGLNGSLVLQNNGGANLTVAANGTFTFTGPLNSGAAYSVSVLTQPGLQTCFVSNGSGSVSANVTNVEVACSDVAPPTLELSVAKTKLFHFSWTRVSSIDRYRLLENPDGSSGFTQVGADIPASATAIDQVTALYRSFNASYILQACGEARCFDSNTVSVTGSLVDAIGYFKASNPHLAAQFGTSIALSEDGTTMAIGAPGERSLARGINQDQSDTGTGNAGAVYVFVRDGTAWVQQAYVKASNTHPVAGFPGDQFGTAVALSADGSVLAVGADLEDSDANGVGGGETEQNDETAGSAGAVYVFSRTGTTWSQQAYIKASNSERGDRFGQHLALSADGRTLAVGATGESSSARGIHSTSDENNVSPVSGAVYVYARPADVWLEQAYVKSSNSAEGDAFGSSLALNADGSTLAVSSFGEDSNATGANGEQFNDNEPESGAVFVFARVGTTWSQQAYLKASNTEEGDRFGSAVALSADGATLAVGAIGEDSSGAVAGESDDTAESSGAVYLFARAANNVWAPREAYLKASNADIDDHFGGSLALSADGQTLVVGATGEMSGARGIGGDETDNNGGFFEGAAYVFKRAGASWSQRAYLKASNARSARFATSVAISGDADVVAAGATFEEGNSPGINGDETSGPLSIAGAVYLY